MATAMSNDSGGSSDGGCSESGSGSVEVEGTSSEDKGSDCSAHHLCVGLVWAGTHVVGLHVVLTLL